MPDFSPKDLAVWTGGAWSRLPEIPLTSVTQDSRDLKPGALYVALPGARVDGHAFLEAAGELGAAGAVCERGRAVASLPCLEVADPGVALQDMARGYRGTLGGLMIGVTGSAGKTTVKDVLATILARRGETCRTRGNWNNQIGLPLSMLSMEADDDFGVFEVGMNRPGEIAALSEILKPICGLVTSIGEAHLEKLGSVDAVAREKSALLAALPAEGVAVLDIDQPWADLFRDRAGKARQVTCSLESEADYIGRGVDGDRARLRVEDRRRGVDFELTMPLPGVHMRRNVLQAVVVARECGLSPDEIREGLGDYSPAPMRWEQIRVGSRLVINDAYNANPLSMRSAIRTFGEMERPVEKWLVLGGMAELGPSEKELHRQVGEFADRFRFRGIIGVGEKAEWICEAVRNAEVWRVADREGAAEVVLRESGPGCGVLLKASRSEGLENVVPLLKESPNSGDVNV